MKTTIEDSLGIEPYEEKKELAPIEHKDEFDENMDADFVEVRDNLKELVQENKDYLDDAMRLARSTEDPKAFMAANQFLKTLMELNSKLVSLYEQRNKSKPKQAESKEPSQVTNNTLFVGSGKELNKLINDLKNGDMTVNDITNTS